MKGYKAFNKDLKCRDMQYEIGGTYKHEGEIVVCQSGFHFCKSVADCYRFYSMNENTRICEVEATGKILTDDDIKFCTDEITILNEIENPRDKSNTNSSNSGYRNSGNYNSGNCNSGCRNSGNYNSGDYNSGNRNTGDYNSGGRNTGDYNSGNRNTGDYNSGNRNTGDYNSGNRNSGDFNRGDRNSGDFNSGDWNSGDWNSGNYNSGVFNIERMPKIKMFDMESDWTMNDWQRSEAFGIMQNCPITVAKWVWTEDMTEAEKDEHPEYKTTGGFSREVIVTNKDKQEWWDRLTDEQKNAVRSLPNFNADKFEMCTGISPRMKKSEEG